MKNNLIRIFYSAPAILTTIIIFIASSMEQPYMPDLGFDFTDKIFHFFAFFAYGAFVAMFLVVNFKNISLKQTVWTVLIIGSIYGASDEFHQYFVPGRMAGVDDWIADTLGTAFSLLLCKTIYYNVRKKLN